MHIFSDCMGCMVGQIKTALELLAPGIEETEIILTQQRLMKFISEIDILNYPSSLLGKKVYEIINEVLKNPDPYKELKEKYNRKAMAYYPDLKKKVWDSDEPLKVALRISIMGNLIDFGAPNEINLEEELNELEKHDLGGPENIDNFIKNLEAAQKILILGDNAGEIVFDKILIETLKTIYPEKDIKYSVRRGPIINDSTMADAESVGMTEICPVLESSATPGIYLEECTPEFVEEFNSADLILSKGQGNFESLVDVELETPKIFFLLKAKCKLMEKIFNVPIGTLLLVEGTRDLAQRVSSRKFS
ncbi:MAG: damage-control phosphatase ARMT1 family protein [Promethearchaeota archaeon]